MGWSSPEPFSIKGSGLHHRRCRSGDSRYLSWEVEMMVYFPGESCYGSIWSSRSLIVRIHDLRAASGGFESHKKSMVVSGRASDLNSLLSSNKVAL